MSGDDRIDLLLALSGGFRVATRDGVIGIVETPLFPPDETVPDFLVLRLSADFRSRRPIVPVALVEDVDLSERIVRVRADDTAIAALPEHLPIAG